MAATVREVAADGVVDDALACGWYRLVGECGEEADGVFG